MRRDILTIPVSCNKDCGAGCPLMAHVVDGHVVRITDSPHRGSYMQGCARGYQMPRTLYAPDRLLVPLVRDGPRGSGQFREVGWVQALDTVTERLSKIGFARLTESFCFPRRDRLREVSL